MSNVIEFPSGAALQIEKDRMRKKPASKVSDEANQLLIAAHVYIGTYKIANKSMLDTPLVANTAIDFIEEMCDIVGYHTEASNEPTPA